MSYSRSNKWLLAGILALLSIVALPIPGVFASAGNDPTIPPAQGEITNEQLEKIWARELKVYDRLGRFFDNSDILIDKAQSLIDKAAKHGKDLSAVQAALDAFAAAIKDAHPTYESAKGIINSHKGFDQNGKVTDPVLARETIRGLGDQLKEIKQSMGGTGRALHEAIKAFREANRPAPVPDDPGT